ncbi:hypothetical protein [Nitrosospira briensis]|uniref:hypothetical protein n=1 Tax=Nitrosospira briensis TaxID=35799 RepID=UPI00046A4041|nr:hypothetical protein [Nitrosospira briensis]
MKQNHIIYDASSGDVKMIITTDNPMTLTLNTPDGYNSIPTETRNIEEIAGVDPGTETVILAG